jgi:hypothetical protein
MYIDHRPGCRLYKHARKQVVNLCFLDEVPMENRNGLVVQMMMSATENSRAADTPLVLLDAPTPIRRIMRGPHRGFV